MPREKAVEDGPNFTPSDEELTSPTSDDVGEQTATSAPAEPEEDEEEEGE